MSKLTHYRTVILEPEQDGSYSVHCPALAGCHSQGDTLEEVMANIKEAILLVIAVLRDGMRQIPIETPEVVSAEIRDILNARAEEGLPLIIKASELKLPNQASSSNC